MEINQVQIVELINQKVDLIINLFQKQKEENKLLIEQLKQKDEHLDNLRTIIQNKESEIEKLQMEMKGINQAGIQSKPDEQVQQKINELILEVDKCMMILNN